MKIFKIDECDYVAAETKEEALDWYRSDIGEQDSEEEIREVDVEKETMWYGFNSDDMRDFVEYCLKEKIKTSFEVRVGWRDYDISIKMTFATALYFENLYDQITPCIISSTEY